MNQSENQSESQEKFIVSHFDQQMGPFSEDELRAHFIKGDLIPIDYVFDEVIQDWVLLSERFTWAKATDPVPPPPVRVDATVLRRTAALLNKTGQNQPDPKHDTLPDIGAASIQPNTAEAHKFAVNMTASAVAGGQTRGVDPAAIKTSMPETNSAGAADEAVTAEVPLRRAAGAMPMPGAGGGGKAAGAQTAGVNTAPRIQLVNGKAEVDLPTQYPGHVELGVQQSTPGPLRLDQPYRIKVHPAEPVNVTWNMETQKIVGQSVEMTLKALDERGQVCLGFHEEFLLQIRGAVSRDERVSLADGEARLRLENTKADTWTLSLLYSGTKKMQLPAAQTLVWQPGPAVKLVFEGPQECITGSPLKLQIKAVDSFGNLATGFQGTITLDMKAG